MKQPLSIFITYNNLNDGADINSFLPFYKQHLLDLTCKYFFFETSGQPTRVSPLPTDFTVNYENILLNRIKDITFILSSLQR